MKKFKLGRRVLAFLLVFIMVVSLMPLNVMCATAGDIVTSEGKVTSGEYIDIIDSKDWIIQQIEYGCQKLLNNSSKLPYSDTGIAALQGVVRTVLQEAFDNGMIATDSEGAALYSVNFKSREDMSDADRASRAYTGGNFTFTLAGAIHSAEINGELQI